MSPKLKQLHAIAGAAIGWTGLVLQYVLLVRSHEGGVASATVRFFSYFTILTNTLVALTYSAMLVRRRDVRPRLLEQPTIQSGIALSIALVGVAYSLLLRQLWDPQGLQLVADRLLHDVSPVLYVLYWVFWVPKRALRWSDPLRWSLYPVAFFGFAIAQAYLTNWYPYPFIDVAGLGAVAVLRNALVILGLFIAAGWGMVAAGRRFGAA